MSLSSITTLLSRNPQLRDLYRQAELNSTAQSLLHRHLPAALAEHCHVALVDGETLTLCADSPAWAARLRYQTQDLLTRLQRDPVLAAIRALRIRTVPAVTKAERDKPKPAISPQTAQLLSQVAESIQDPGLRAALLRLSRQ